MTGKSSRPGSACRESRDWSEREPHGECGGLSSRRLNLYGAAVLADDSLANSQTQAASVDGHTARLIPTDKPLEDAWLQIGSDSGASVSDCEFRHAGPISKFYRHAAVLMV